MTKRMLIDSTHAEETRVVVLDGNRLEDYDVETSTKQQLKGNIYLAKIVRVEPSLQAAFVEFGGGRHGFLAFGEIHPDYYQIPVADRKRLVELQEAEAREEEEEEEREANRRERGGRGRGNRPTDSAPTDSAPADEPAEDPAVLMPEAAHEPHDFIPYTPDPDEPADSEPADAEPPASANGFSQEPAAADALTEAGYAMQADPEAMPAPTQVAQPAAIAQDILVAPDEAQALFPDATEEAQAALPDAAEPAHADAAESAPEDDEAPHDLEAAQDGVEIIPPTPEPEHIGGELDTDDRPDRRQTPRFMRNYKIQEVMRRRQILLVQVVKEERGTKGAALTTYISLAGRFSVLMPNSPRGGGISRKITSAADRRRLKEITAELDLPRGMGLIVRTAGAARPKPEIIRDCEYLLSQWDQIRDLTMKSMAPALIYEEASLIKRAIRDVYSRDVDEILVDGEEGWRAARDFMRMLMPAHAKKVQLWRDPQPLFAKAQVESQLDAMLQPSVQLRSGGYLVINQTEALVAIDVNSGRSTRERGIEETALRTNMEAAEEAARQLRLRDLAGLIVIDFIDMESRRNNASVEKKLKDALKNDRARIQVGSISHFGLLEMSRQRLRPSLAETSFIPCPHCGGTGHMRSTESAALAVLRGIEDEGSRRRSAEVVVHVHASIALYILNHKRVRLAEIEQRYGLHVTFQADDTLIPPAMRIEKVRALLPSDIPAPVSAPVPEPVEDPDDAVMEADDVDSDAGETVTDEEAEPDEEAPRPGETAEEGEQRQRKRRRRRRGGRREEAGSPDAGGEAVGETDAVGEPGFTPGADAEAPDMPSTPSTPGLMDEAPSEGPTPVAAVPGEAADDGSLPEGDRKRRGRRGGRRRRREPEAGAGIEGAETDGEAPGAGPAMEAPYTPAPYVPPAYTPAPYAGPTPANPFGGDSNAFAFFDAVEDVPPAPPRPAPAPKAADPIAPPAPEAVVAPAAPPPEAAPEAAAPKPATPEPATPDLAAIEASAAEATVPHPEPIPEPTPEPAPEPVQEAAAGPVIGPAIVPIVLGAPDAVVAEKKRGWWRR